MCSREPLQPPWSCTRAAAASIATPWLQVVPLAGALLAFGLAEAIGGSGLHRGVRRRASSSAGCADAARRRRLVPHGAGGRRARRRDLRRLRRGAPRAGDSATSRGRSRSTRCSASRSSAWFPLRSRCSGPGARRPTVAFLGWFGPAGRRVDRLRAAGARGGRAPARRRDPARPRSSPSGSPSSRTELTRRAARDALRGLARRLAGAEHARSSRAGGARAPLASRARGGCMRIVSHGGGAPDRGARAAPRRLGDERPRHGPAARLPPDRPDLDGRAAAAARPLEPARAVRRRRARPPALGRAEAARVERLHLADRVRSRCSARACAGGAPARPRRSGECDGVPPRARAPSSATSCASSSATAPCSRASSASTRARSATSSIPGGARGTCRSCSRS